MTLAIETATDLCSTAVVNNGEVVCHRTIDEKNIHSERLLVLIDDMLTAERMDMRNIDAVAISIGPGSFTGLRIGLSTAKGLAVARKIPIIPVPTLDGLAEEYRRIHSETVAGEFCAMIDAKRNEAYFAFYRITTSDAERLTEYSIAPKQDILHQAEQRRASVEVPACNAVAIGRLALHRSMRSDLSGYDELEPLYLRDFAATSPARKITR